jgi:glycosyltransferase involved in cell wall biosynthesis
MKMLFTFENPLPNVEADAEVFITTARHLGRLNPHSWLHVPTAGVPGREAAAVLSAMPVIAAAAPLRPAALRHFCCGLTLPFRRIFRQADIVYTRNLWVAWMSVLFGQQVVFDHYRPWADQIPPLQLLIYRLFCHPRFLVNICHSDYTRRKYLELGVPPAKLHRVHNGFDPARFQTPVAMADAKRALGLDPVQKVVVYTGRINAKKGLELLLEAARSLPEMLFFLVGSYGEGPIETLARSAGNVRIIPWQAPEQLGAYVFAADALVIPPSLQPLHSFGSTVLPLKLFFYMGSGRPILAGDTPDVAEILQNRRNALLLPPDDVAALVAGIKDVTNEAAFAARLAAAAKADSQDLTWERRAQRIKAIIESRLKTARDERGSWGKAQSRTWRQQSRRWLVHLLRKRSVILPPLSTG